ncbi:MAG: HD domain-containing protein [Nitrospiraceae bacterium]|nr:HD domain-containing protein [Nitrospiraceae bacterium]
MHEKEIFTEIVLNNSKREKFLSQCACKNNRGIRKHPKREKIPDRGNIRPRFFHDTDKIIHSKAYSRYIDKTQVFSLFENDHITHRVLHVQFVSKIARVIGRCLKLNEDLIEAIALGHDLGHVPYGHDGEKMLNELCQKNNIGYFCHNAQSVRFLMEIERGGDGLNLSLQVLDGILSHNGEILDREYKPEYDKSWDKFEEEYRNCFKLEDYSKRIVPMTLEGCVVRISDIIAYIGRDIEDAISVKLIKRGDIPSKITGILGNTNDEIINKLVLDLVKNSYNKEYLIFSQNVFRALENLKKFNSDHIYSNPLIKTEAKKIQRVFKRLFYTYKESLSNNSQSAIQEHFLNEMNENYLKITSNERKIIDFIAGMTDDFFNNQHKELFVPQSYGYFVRK